MCHVFGVCTMAGPCIQHKPREPDAPQSGTCDCPAHPHHHQLEADCPEQRSGLGMHNGVRPLSKSKNLAEAKMPYRPCVPAARIVGQHNKSPCLRCNTSELLSRMISRAGPFSPAGSLPDQREDLHLQESPKHRTTPAQAEMCPDKVQLWAKSNLTILRAAGFVIKIHIEFMCMMCKHVNDISYALKHSINLISLWSVLHGCRLSRSHQTT